MKQALVVVIFGLCVWSVAQWVEERREEQARIECQAFLSALREYNDAP